MHLRQQHYSINPDSLDESPQKSYRTRQCSIGHAFSLFWTHYVDFLNYSTRAEFWWVKLWELIIYGGTIALVSLFYGNTLISSVHNPGNGAAALFGILLSIGVLGIVLLLFYLATLIPLWALRVRRFNDAGLPNILSICIVAIRPVLYGLGAKASAFSFLWYFMILVSFIIEVLPTGTFKANSPSITTPYGNFYPSPSMNPYNRPPMLNYNPYQNNAYRPQGPQPYYQPNQRPINQNMNQSPHVYKPK